jgi:hypothetical protein
LSPKAKTFSPEGKIGSWHRWNRGGWTGAPGARVAITVVPNGHPWIVNFGRAIYGS